MGSRDRGSVTCGVLLNGTTEGISDVGTMLCGTIIGSNYSKPTGTPANNPPTPAQITPNPHNIPIRASKKPQQNNGAQHKGTQQPFLLGGSSSKARYLLSSYSVPYSLL